MRTTIVLDDGLMRQAKKLTGIKTKKSLIDKSLKELIKQKRRERLISRLGRMSLNITAKSLNVMRLSG